MSFNKSRLSAIIEGKFSPSAIEEQTSETLTSEEQAGEQIALAYSEQDSLNKSMSERRVELFGDSELAQVSHLPWLKQVAAVHKYGTCAQAVINLQRFFERIYAVSVTQVGSESPWRGVFALQDVLEPNAFGVFDEKVHATLGDFALTSQVSRKGNFKGYSLRVKGTMTDADGKVYEIQPNRFVSLDMETRQNRDQWESTPGRIIKLLSRCKTLEQAKGLVAQIHAGEMDLDGNIIDVPELETATS